MQLISKKIVDQTWPEVAQYSRDKMVKEIKKFGEVQPHIIDFILTFCQDLDKEARELGLYMTYVLFRMVEKGYGKKLPEISPEEIIEAYESNEELCEAMEEVDDRFIERYMMHSGQLKQIYLFQYIVETLYEDPDNLELDDDTTGYLFLLLKTVIDAFDRIE